MAPGTDRWVLLEAFRPGAARDEALADALEALWGAATADFPTVKLDAAAFMRHLAAHAKDAPAEVRAADLYLACACLAGDAAALSELDARIIARLDKAIAGVDSAADFVDELRQRVRERLLVGDPPRLAEYSGQGSLLGWARTVAVRLALNEKRAHRREVVEDDEALAELPLSGHDVELEYVRAQHRADFTAAFREALAALEPRARNVLRLSCVDRLSIDQIGALYGAHRATAARWLTAAREALVAGTREQLKQRLQLTPSEVDSLLTALQSHLEVSLKGFLGVPQSIPKP